MRPQLLTGKNQAENAIQMQTWAVPYGKRRMASVESRVQRREAGPKLRRRERRVGLAVLGMAEAEEVEEVEGKQERQAHSR